MALVTLAGDTPAALTGVLVTTKVDGYSISWNPQPVGSRVEVWQSITNDRADADLVKTVIDTYYDSATLGSGTSYFLWVRTVNQYGIPGDWDVGDTAGHEVEVLGIDNGQVSPQTANTTFSVSLSGAGSSLITSYNTWQLISSSSIPANTLFASAETIMWGYTTTDLSSVSSTLTTGTVTGSVDWRLRLKRDSDGVYIGSQEVRATTAAISVVMFSGSPSIKQFVNPLNPSTTKIRFGNAGGVPPVAYTMELEAKKTNSDTSKLSFTASVGYYFEGQGSVVAF
ncbi:hypothetical protein QTI05_24165 [Variovorax sp. J22R193]|uniref:hypothetical protein n=1 Tax=Variovorax fucosicus TaxID=3053517 RepID=UPI002577D278|nr:hypothetical protein [Variovorax sp. J22R193]MDM0042155.1 hypothetical protein [Variovorax sp. J22R193]